MLKKTLARLRDLVRHRDADNQLDREMAFHLDKQTRKNLAAASPAEETRREASLAFGGGKATKEAVRDTRTLWIDAIRQDVKYGVRGLRRNPGFTVAVIVTLGLGIGANSAIFSVVNGIILRPLPVRDADRLTVIGVTRGPRATAGPLSRPDMEDYRRQADAFEGVAGYAMDFGSLHADNRAERVWMTYVSDNYFSLLGLQPSAGRLIRLGEGRAPGADPVLVLSHSYWQRRFNRDPDVIGKAVRLNGRPFTIVGVAPEGFQGAYAFIEMDVFTPLGMMAVVPVWRGAWDDRTDGNVRTLARLKPGVSLAQAQASLDIVGRRLAAQYPETNKNVKPVVFWETHARPDPSAAAVLPVAMSVFVGLVALVLLVACINVAGLLLARGTVRAKELTLRNALGAGRLRLVQQLLTESLLLSMLGGIVGLLLGAWTSRLLAGIRLPNDLPIRFDFGFDWRVFAYVGCVVLMSGLLAGVVPAIRASAVKAGNALREAGRATGGGAGRHRLRDLLVVTQVAGSLVVLVVAGLFVRSVASAHRLELGFQPDHVMNFFMNPAEASHDEAWARAFYRDLQARVRAMPGVASASLAHSMPLGYYNIGKEIEKEGQTLARDERGVQADCNVVDDDYQPTMGIRLLRGRWLTQAGEDAARPSVVVNETLAGRLWPGEDALGKRFRVRGEERMLEVVGVAANGKYNSIRERPRAFFYVPHALEFRALRVLHVRTTGAPEAIVPLVRKAVAELAPDVLLFDVASMERVVGGGNGFFLVRLAARFAAALGLLGLAVALVGLYGVVAYAASQRTHEIGIRMALGAGRRRIVAMVVRHGLWLVGVGSAAGIVLALVLARGVTSLLFDVKPYDPLTYGVVTGVLALVTLAACYLPARRASRVEPTVALRGEWR